MVLQGSIREDEGVLFKDLAVSKESGVITFSEGVSKSIVYEYEDTSRGSVSASSSSDVLL